MRTQYLIRLDDACPTMDIRRWDRIESILDKYGVKPMVGIVPHCKDKQLLINDPTSDFWDRALEWQKKGWAIALHGYDHCYISDCAGENPMWRRSEFAGVDLQCQKDKIRKGIAILKEKKLIPKYFFAPSHTFDCNTLIALREDSEIRIISDTVGRYPYKKDDFYYIPQIVGHCTRIPLSGIYTFCFHPNVMDDNDFDKLDDFLYRNRKDFIGFDKIKTEQWGKKKWLDRQLSALFFFYRRIRGLK